MVPTFGIVVVRYDSHIESQLAEDVETLKPTWLTSDFVNLVDGNCVATQSERCGRSKGHRSTSAHFRAHDFGNCGPRPLTQRVCGTSGSSEDIICLTNTTQTLLNHKRVGPMDLCQPSDFNVVAHALTEILNCLGRKFRRVFLETVRRVKNDCLRCAWKPSNEFTMMLHHRRRCFT
ncbi:unannotated protein [freshwater metagenome]|uniref:Unannotated protein n=1 Tax=freshwater metagenome TaxID=449393 RepID=A0A6J7VV51_9ZZZZ